MNTKKWGSPAWKFLHCIAFNYKATETNKTNYKKFFTLIGNILPCRFCRESYKVFIKELPINKYLKYDKGVFEWLYLMHNKVNDKLRNQGNDVKDNPSYNRIHNLYEKLYNNYKKKKECRCGSGGWYFIHSVATNYDGSAEKKNAYLKFFDVLPKVLPHNYNLTKAFKKYPIRNYLGKNELPYWAYLIHSEVNKSLKKESPKFERICQKYEKIRAKCSTQTGSCTI